MSDDSKEKYSDEEVLDIEILDEESFEEDAGGDIDFDDILEEDAESFDDEFKKIKKNTKKAGSGKIYDIIRYVIMAVALAVFVGSMYMLINIFLEYKKGVDIYENISNNVFVPLEKSTDGNNKEEDGGELEFVYDHEALLRINPEGQGYLYIPSIDLRLPVAQGSDNDYYLTHTFNRVYNGAGALFVDWRVENGIMGYNAIIYGHNMRNGSMFAKLLNYRNASFYRNPGNDTFYIYTGDKIREYRIFAAYEYDPAGYVYTCNFTTEEQLQEYAATVKSYSLYETNVDVSDAGQVVTFSTCTSDGERRVIVQGVFAGERGLNAE